MHLDRLKYLAGLNEETGDKLPIGLFFRITDHSNMTKAVDALLSAGLAVELNYSMGVYYFNFKNESVADEAHKVASKVIDRKKEETWSD